MKLGKTLYVTNRKAGRGWPSITPGKKEVWLIYYKKHTGRPRIPYDDAVEEALCTAGSMLRGIARKFSSNGRVIF